MTALGLECLSCTHSQLHSKAVACFAVNWIDWAKALSCTGNVQYERLLIQWLPLSSSLLIAKLQHKAASRALAKVRTQDTSRAERLLTNIVVTVIKGTLCQVLEQRVT